ncbi:TRAPP trafficking subunit Trs65-domain-containing protein [Papiliotrema laurentii]|uniref:TRAPP trafficking subunit Trs65-domain-containing protein n=1 Tax=Papiliotrema laurentii TaxID=5418 RepID=A0AAD9CY85_PAPLA|nr:TRAPP trafficking subunit Trs65-domain-containing protein [Papiliotrema laurentii]
MPGSSAGGPNFESVFHHTSVDLYIPAFSSTARDTDEGVWWESIKDAPLRQVTFLDEKLSYVVALSIPDHVFSPSASSSSPEPPSDLLRFLSRLQLSMSASLLPPLNVPPPSLTLTHQTPDPNSLVPPATPHVPHAPHMPTTPNASGSLVTPMPKPRMHDEQEHYAAIEGVTVWEGTVAELDGHGVKERLEGSAGGRVIIRVENGWEVVYKGQVPVVYVRTQIQNPVLSLTASVTLRDAPARKKAVNAETGSIFSNAESTRTDGTEDVEVEDDEEEDVAVMEEIDLLGGLGDERVPTSRLAQSLREDLSLPPVLPSGSVPPSAASLSSFHQPTPSTASMPSTAGVARERHAAPIPSSPLNTTLRKSYRRILTLSSGLRVRMRTLFLPQLLPPRSGLEQQDDEDEGERRVALCVEVENPLDSPAMAFEVESITVDVGGKGGKAQASLICQPEQQSADTSVFPLLLDPVEQYNLLYAVSIASTSEDRSTSLSVEEAVAKTLGKGDEQRPVTINVIGRPRGENGEYPAETFSSRWNCTLDLAPFYAAAGGPPMPSSRVGSMKPVPVAPNAIAGDKRFSLASLAGPSGPPGSRNGGQRVASMTQRPVGPGSRVNSVRGSMIPGQQSQGHGLLVSVKVLDQPQTEDEGTHAGSGSRSGVRPLDPFSLEVFVHNRSDEVRRFRLGVPQREDSSRVRDALAKRRKRRDDEPAWGVEDPVLKQMLLSHLSSAPALIPLEDDLRCGPLLPGASMSARLRFLALREGVHTLSQLRVTGANEEFDFVLSPVLDIVVGSGVDHH